MTRQPQTLLEIADEPSFGVLLFGGVLLTVVGLAIAAILAQNAKVAQESPS